MTLTYTHDIDATMEQIGHLASAGCEIVRVAVPKNEDAAALKKLVYLSPLPIIADIHFNASLALKAIEAGVAAVRINPGNIGGPDKVEQVVKAADHGVRQVTHLLQLKDQAPRLRLCTHGAPGCCAGLRRPTTDVRP